MNVATVNIATVASVAALAAAVISLNACSDSAQRERQAEAKARITPEYVEGKLSKLSYDRDGNGTPDTFGYMDGARVLRVEADTNNDGRIDLWEYHRPGAATSATPEADALAATPVKTVERIDRATRFDDKVTRREFYKDGVLTKVEEDTDADGRVDKWETYVNGVLATTSLDTTHSGRADRRLVYGPDGAFLRIEADPNGTGTFAPLP